LRQTLGLLDGLGPSHARARLPSAGTQYLVIVPEIGNFCRAARSRCRAAGGSWEITAIELT